MSDAFKKHESLKANESHKRFNKKIQTLLASTKKLMVAFAAQHHAAFWSEQ